MRIIFLDWIDLSCALDWRVCAKSLLYVSVGEGHMHWTSYLSLGMFFLFSLLAPSSCLRLKFMVLKSKFQCESVSSSIISDHPFHSVTRRLTLVMSENLLSILQTCTFLSISLPLSKITCWVFLSIHEDDAFLLARFCAKVCVFSEAIY